MIPAALLIDAALGEPPARLHPTVWMGHAAAAFDGLGSRARSRNTRRLAGFAAAFTVPTASYALTAVFLRPLPVSLRPAVQAAIISVSLSMRGLAAGALSVEEALRRGELEVARARTSGIVGRDTAALDETDLARAAVESVAENASDGVAAPMLYAALAGAPGAIAYRAVNTLDSMLGYREGSYEDLGLAPARLDDLANLLPARLTALAVAAVCGHPLRTLRSVRRYGALHASPNAGRPEAAFAGALGVTLGGGSYYSGELRPAEPIGDGPKPAADDILRAVVLMRRTCMVLALVLSLTGARRRLCD